MEPQDATAAIECPECKQNSLLYNPYYKLYECKNEACKANFSQKDWERILAKQAESTSQTAPAKPKKRKKIKYRTIRTGEPLYLKILLFPFRLLWGLIKLILFFVDWD
ncbi:hypothetical protein ACFLVR_03965 [Chloroflexota bacterium]